METGNTEDNPPPAPPMGKKTDIFDPEKFKDIDTRAAEAPDILLLSFGDLIAYLTDGLTSDVAKLRIIFMWIGHQELLDKEKYSMNHPSDTPYYYLQNITLSSDVGLTATLFQILCRLAGLPYNMVSGYTKKFVGYVVGDDIKKGNYMWNVVFVDGSWRIVDIEIAFTGFISENTDWLLLEDSGEAVRQRNEGRPKRVQHINENFFMPDPEDFIYLNFPEDPAWQLLQEPWSKEQFIKTPVVTWRYLHTDWHLAKQHEAIIDAPEGICWISMDQIPEGQCTIGYMLFYNEKRSKRTFSDQLQLDNYIEKDGNKSLMTRLPEPGIYKLEIMDGKKSKLCEVLIKATGKMKENKPFPPIPETGLGINQAAIDAGLVDPSRTDGLVIAREGEKIRFKFRPNKPLDIVTRLAHNVFPSQKLDSRITHEEEDGTVTITVTVPFDANPEYSLQVDAKPKDSEDAQLVNVINYLLTPDRLLVHARRGKEQQLREELSVAAAGDDLHRLESAIREFRVGQVKDDDLYEKACNHLFLLHRSAVENVKADENKLATALSDVEQSHVVYRLHRADWLHEAQETYRRMRRLSSVKHQVESLSAKQISEIQTYHHPTAGIQAVVKATFLLLGENMKKLKKWSYVQTLLRRHGKMSVTHRIRNHDVSTVNEKSLELSTSLLSSCSHDELRCMSVSAAAFYDWSKAVVDTMTETHKDNATNAQKHTPTTRVEEPVLK